MVLAVFDRRSSYVFDWIYRKFKRSLHVGDHAYSETELFLSSYIPNCYEGVDLPQALVH